MIPDLKDSMQVLQKSTKLNRDIKEKRVGETDVEKPRSNETGKSPHTGTRG